MTWRAMLSRQWMGDDVAPTSLNEGRGEVVLAFVVVLYLDLKRCLVD